MKSFKSIFIVVLSLAFCIPLFAGDDFQLSGFVDASYSGNLDKQKDSFSLDQVELDAIRSINENVVLRFDAEWANDGTGEMAPDIEQGYLKFTCPNMDNISFTFGKFNAPIGFEMLDAPDMYQFSHSLIFDNCLPTNLTGLMVGFDNGSGVDLKAYVVNGWDENVDQNAKKTYGGRFGYNISELGVLGVSYIAGIENGGYDRSVFDIDLTITSTKNMIIGAEYNMGSEDIYSYEVEWSGFMLMGHYDFNDSFGFTGRYDMLSIEDNANDIKYSSLTVAPTFVLGSGMGALIEYRMDMCDEDAFSDKDGELKSSTSTVAFELTYTF